MGNGKVAALGFTTTRKQLLFERAAISECPCQLRAALARINGLLFVRRYVGATAGEQRNHAWQEQDW